MKTAPTISVIIPTYKREQVLIDTLHALVPLLRTDDEILVIDQTPQHEPATEESLRRLVASGVVRWYRRNKPSQCEAMNAAALLAHCDILLFLDDDVIPFAQLLEGHRAALAGPTAPSATCGQVLQPWHAAEVDRVDDFATGFNPAYSQPCDILSLIACNYAIRRDTYIDIGGMDENFDGSNYRNDTEMSYRIAARTGAKVRFVPEAGLRHLHCDGGNRAFGAKDTWGHIGGSIGDYYFAMRWLPLGHCLAHCLTRFVRAPLNRNTFQNPWLIPMLFVRESVAWFRALWRLVTRRNNYIKPVADYALVRVA